MTQAIHYSAVRVPPKPGQVYGLQVAILDWLRAYLRHGRQDRLTFLVGDEASAAELQEIAAEDGIHAARLAILDARFPRENFGSLACVFRPDPDPHHLLWQRNLLNGPSFAFCGLAHAISGVEAGRALEAYCQAPTSQADAIICPSRAVASAIRGYWEHYAAFLKERWGVSYECPAQLPVIPLGVDTARIAARVTPDRRVAQRAALQIDDDAITLLWVGRLSHAIKAHPLPMFRAAEEAARRTGKKVHLVMQGYFVPEEAAQDFAALARDVCVTAQVSFVAANDPRFPDGLWAAGDLFLSLVDNVQESFGLTPIEAIAAGLPRIIADWDGYRDSVTQGQDGFLIPTFQPPAGAGGDLAALNLGGRESYGGALAQTAQCVAVDHRAAADAIVALIENPALRAQMAMQAKKRLPDYDWARLIPAYEDLWGELSARRSALPRLKTVHPHAPDPFAMYAAYPSHILGPETRLVLAAGDEEIRKILGHGMNVLALDRMIPASDLPALLSALSQPQTPAQLAAAFPTQEAQRLSRTLCWLLKLGLIASLPD